MLNQFEPLPFPKSTPDCIIIYKTDYYSTELSSFWGAFSLSNSPVMVYYISAQFLRNVLIFKYNYILTLLWHYSLYIIGCRPL